MKLVLYGIAALAFLIAGGFVVGLLLPKAHTASRSAVFRASPERLFALIDGPQMWRSGVKHYQELAATEGLRRWQETDSHGQTITYEALERRPPTRLRTRIVTPGLPYGGTWTLDLAPSDGGTLVRITEDGEVYNPFFRVISRFVLGYTRTINTYLHDLATALDERIESRD